MHEANQTRLLPAIFIGVGLLLLLFGVWPASALKWARVVANDSELQRMSQFGDAFGGLAALFSALAFLVVSVGLWHEMRLNRRREDESTTQFQLLRKQAFEATFFNQLKFIRELIGSSSFYDRKSGAGRSVVGREGLAMVAQAIKESVEGHAKGWPLIPNQALLPELMRSAYEPEYRIYEDSLGPYFRGVFHLFKMIDQTKDVDRLFYANLARAQLGSSELTLLAANCVAFHSAGLRPFVVKYGLLKQLYDDGRPFMLNIKAAYPPSAFGLATT